MPIGVRKAGINKHIAAAAEKRKNLDKYINEEVAAIAEKQRLLELRTGGIGWGGCRAH